MKTKLSALLAIILLVFTGNVKAKDILLRFNLQKGSIYEMTMNMTNNIDQQVMGQKMKIDQTMEMVFSYQVLEVLPNANFAIEYSMQKMKLSMKINDKEMGFDSDSIDENNPASKVLAAMKSAKLKIEMNARGQVQKIEGIDSFAKEFSGNPQMSKMMSMFSSDKSFESFINQTFNYFPENEVKEGSKWTASLNLPAMMNMATNINFEVASVKKDNVLLNMNSDVNMDSPIEQNGMKINMKMTGTQTGTMNIDPNDGWIRSSNLNQKFDMNMKLKNPQSGEDMEIPMNVNSIAKITIVKK